MEQEHSRSGHPSKDLPWEDVAANPHDFYDTVQYSFLSFKRPDVTNLLPLYALAEKLAEHCSVSSPQPFMFKWTGSRLSNDSNTTQGVEHNEETRVSAIDVQQKTASSATDTFAVRTAFSPRLTP